MIAAPRPACLVWVCCCAAACAPQAGQPEAALTQLDAMFLAPPLEPGGPLLLCGRHEITRREFAPDAADPTLVEGDFPAVFMTRDEAQAWAQQRGLRLPRLAEWLHLAGLQGEESAWSSFEQRVAPGTANVQEFAVHGALPVGVFERSVHPFGAYDFAGNVWEWVADAPGYQEDGLPARGLACGGSYTTTGEGASLAALQRWVEPGERWEDLGFRVVADAERWLAERVLPVWRLGRRGDREAVGDSCRRWRAGLRLELARRLEQNGADADFCALLRDPAP